MVSQRVLRGMLAWVGSVIGVSIILANRGQEEGDEEEENPGHYLPFGPYICLGFLIVMVLGADQAFQLYLGAIQAVTGTLVGAEPYGP